MKRCKVLVLLALFFSIFLISKNVFAEIATARDWIGLFPVGAADGKTNTVATPVTATFADGRMWVYANSCTQTPGTSPSLNNSDPKTSCSITLNPIPASGNFEFRLYANDQQTPDALIAVSSAISANPTSSPGPGGGVNCPIQNIYPRVQRGLISTLSISNNFGNPSAACVISNQAAFAPFKIPGYDDLKSIYLTQSKAPKPAPNPNTGTTLGAVAEGSVYNYTNISGVSVGVYNYTGTAVVFIDGSLSITGNITGTSNMGLVLVVGGDINIATTVTQIDAVLISNGHIYTADSGCSHTSPVTASQLIVNGSLISLNSANNIEFCRTLGAGNTSPAELVNNQPKYVVILRNLYADTLQKWSEIQ